MISLPPSLTEREQVERLAYHLYEDEGKPEGRAGVHWARAEEFIHAQRLAIAASSQKPEARSLESSIKKACQSISESCGQGIRDFEDKVRATPLVAVSLGMLAGYLFPITLILGFVARLLLFSIKPLLLIFGAAKLYELIQQKRGNSWSPGDLSDRPARGTV
jgi:Protein of unknown function (DUF2934)